jgi:hypothetical protein
MLIMKKKEKQKFDLSTITIKRCAKCSSTTDIIRHHKGNDRLLGRYNHSIRRNYRRFFHCVKICRNCHAIIHTIYEFLILTYITKYNAKRLRVKYINLCNQWLGSSKFDNEYNINHPRVQEYLNVIWRRS